MTLTSIIDPGLMDALEAQGFFPDTGTVQTFTIAMVEGEPTETWANLAGHTNLDCAIAALTAREIETLDKTIADSTHQTRLTDYYVGITAAMRFVSGGVTYLITGVDHDQQDTMTRLMLKVITL